MIDRIEGLSVLKQRDYIKAENEACETLRSNGFIASGSSSKLGEAVVVFKKKNEYENDYLGEYKNFQEAKEQLIEKK